MNPLGLNSMEGGSILYNRIWAPGPYSTGNMDPGLICHGVQFYMTPALTQSLDNDVSFICTRL